MSCLFYIDRVITDLELKGTTIVAHVCNESGIWSGTTCKEIYSKWPMARSRYYHWYRHRVRNDFAIGQVQFVDIPPVRLADRISIANMVAQTSKSKPVKYTAFSRCLAEVARKARRVGASVYLAKIDGEQTDSWSDLLQIIECQLVNAKVSVFVYQGSRSIDSQWFGAVIDR